MHECLQTTHLIADHELLLCNILASGFDGVEETILDGDADLLDDIGHERTAIAAKSVSLSAKFIS